MLKRICQLCCCWLLLLTIHVHAQNSSLHIENITFPQGFQVRSCEQIYQDTTGLIWIFGFGKNRVFTYNGIEVEEVNRSDHFPDELLDLNWNHTYVDPYFYLTADSVFVFSPSSKDIQYVLDYAPEIVAQYPEIKQISRAWSSQEGVIWGFSNWIPKAKGTGQYRYVIRSENHQPFQLIDTFHQEKTYFGAWIFTANERLLVRGKSRLLEFKKSGRTGEFFFPTGKDPIMPNVRIDEDQTIWAIYSKDHVQYDIYYKTEQSPNFVQLEEENGFPQQGNNARIYHRNHHLWHWGIPFSLSRKNTNSGKVEDLTAQILAQQHNFPIYNSQLRNIFEDEGGVLFFLTDDGISKVTIYDELFEQFEVNKPNCPDGKCRILGIAEDEADHLYLSYQNGIEKIHLPTGERSSLDLNIPPQTQKQHSLFHDNGFLYWNEYQIDLSNNSVKRLVDVDAYRQILVRLDQRQQKIWLGVNGSAYDLFVYDLSRDSTAQIILPDSISASSKLFSYISNLVIHPKLDTVYVTFDDQILKFDKAAQLLAMQKASKQNFLWKLSHVDLSNWEVEDRSLDLSAYQNDPFYRQLPRTFNLLQGNGQQLWAITEKGVFELNAPTQNMTSFPMFPIFSEILFQDLPAFSSPSGKIYHGLNNGTVIAFAPQDLKKAAVLKQSFPIALSRYQWYDAKRDRIFQQKTELYKLKKIELKHYERYFELSFFVPDYRKPDQNKYRWWLEGYEKNWSIPSSSNQLRYENLPAGNYTLHLQGGLTEDYFKSSEKIIRIKVLRAWYKQWWAWMIYIILVGSLIGWMYRFQLLRRLEKAEVKRVAELDLIKSRFYTNITHEFRTPLTVILGMAQEEKDFSKARTLITRNGKKLLQLINQLLDLSKLDSKHLQANYQQIEIVSFTQYIGESFQSLAEKKHIRLTIYSEINELWMDMDEEKYQQIIGNLLSNAIKFTPESGKITLHLTHKAQTFQIGIKDNGVGIATAELPHIFDRFYQVDNTASQQGKGTGIGLALVKELVELMEGAIEVESCPKEGTTFRIHFPIRTNANEQLTTFQKWTIDQSIVEQAAQAVTMPTEDAPSLLIVEDNSDVVHYIQSVLQSSYRLSIASNGEDGIQKAIEIVPDIIISDVMMPKKNGFEVVETLKQDERTSHIPIILLTAKATQADKIEGLKYGADAYLMKPFDKTELLIRLKNLIEVRRQLQARYAGFKVSDTSEAENLFASNGTLEDQFLQKVQDLLKTNYQNTQFGVEDYAQALQMSHTQFYRKLKALTNQTPSQHVRGYRLAQAKILLKNPNFNISEVAYEVGFNDPNYFTRVFTKAFGRSPNAYRNS